MPRHCRSGWHRMCPNRAFCDQNRLPHSLQGGVTSSAKGSGFLLGLGLEVPDESAPSKSSLLPISVGERIGLSSTMTVLLLSETGRSNASALLGFGSLIGGNDQPAALGLLS